MNRIVESYNKFWSKLTDLSPLIFRMILVFGFLSPAIKKVSNLAGTAKYFERLEIPLPTLNAYLASFTEMAGVILLFLGLWTRYISIPLIITMLVAIITAHIDNGFYAINRGYQIPLYYILMLISLLITGSGRISIDYLIRKKRDN